MARPMIMTGALAAILAVAACTRTPSSTATGGEPAPATRSPVPASPNTQPGVPVPDSRTPQPAPDSAAPGPPSTTPAHPVGTSTTDNESGRRSADSARVAQLEHDAVALAKTTGCSSDDQCRNAPVGIKACGGPRYYLKYCAASTDSVALFRALARLDTAERAYNAKYHVVSTCQMILPTRPHVVAGACR